MVAMPLANGDPPSTLFQGNPAPPPGTLVEKKKAENQASEWAQVKSGHVPWQKPALSDLQALRGERQALHGSP